MNNIDGKTSDKYKVQPIVHEENPKPKFVNSYLKKKIKRRKTKK